MSTFWALWRTQLNQAYGLSNLRFLFRTDRRKLLRKVVLVPIIIMALLPLLGMFTQMYRFIYQFTHPLGQDTVVLALAFVITQTTALVFGLFYLTSYFYFAKDLDLLIPLPVKPGTILLSKFLTVVINEYIIVFPLVGCALYVYGSLASPGLLFWVLAIIVTLALPIVPLAISSVFVIVLMKVTNVRQGRGFMRVAGSLLGLAFYFTIQWFQVRFRNQGPTQIQAMLTQQNGLLNLVTRKFPPSLWAAKGVLLSPTTTGLLNLGLFLAITLVAIVFLYWLGNRIFFKGLIGGSETSAKRKKVALDSKQIKTTGIFATLFTRELKNLIRSASFLMPILINIIILPVALLIPILTGRNQNTGLLLQQLQTSPWLHYLTIFGVSGVLAWVSAANGIASTALSREGSTFWISKIIPAPPFQQILAKMLLALLVPIVMIVLVLSVEGSMLRFTPLELGLQLLLGLLGSLMAIEFGLFMEILNPKLNWTDPQQVMKRNFNAVISNFGLMAVAGATFGLSWFAQQKWSVSPPIIYTVVTLTWTLVTLTLGILLYTQADRRYKKIVT